MRINEIFRRVPITIVNVVKQYVSDTECVFVGLVIQHAARVRSFLICGLFVSIILFPH